MGLFPYIFTRRRHISFTLTLALPLWLGRILISILYQYNNLLAHLVPTGTPSFLIPVIVVIETVRNIIRPLTLSIRLAANIVAGHLLLTLLGSQGPILRIFNLILLIGGLFILLLLEVAVACIQSYVFTILSSLYLNELLRNEFNKKMIR
jgi:F-type H+-transporting ATPase subunit a